MTHVSIVIPCHNHARFLADAIESALGQTWRPVEIVVVDDGSTDGSARVADRYGVKLLRQRKQGLAAARNAGLRASIGETLVFLDADDRLRPDGVAAGVEALAAHPAAMLAVGRCVLIDEAGRPLPTEAPCVNGNVLEELLQRNYIWMPGMAAFRREVFDRVGLFDPRVNPSADYDMYLRVAERFAVITHDRIVAEYRRHGANMSGDPVLMLDHTLSVMRRHRRHARQTPRAWEAYRRGIRQWREFYGEQQVERFRAAWQHRRLAEAVRCALQLLRLYPRGVAVHLLKKARLIVSGATPSRGDSRKHVDPRRRRPAGLSGRARQP